MSALNSRPLVGLAIGGALLITSITLGQAELTKPAGWSLVSDDTPLAHEYAPNRLVMRFRDTASADARAKILAEIGGTIDDSWWLVPGLVSVDMELDVPTALDRIGARDDVLLYVEPDYIVRTFDTIPNDPMYGDLYGMPQIRAPQAWDDHVGTQSFEVVVIDTGVDYGHVDLIQNAWTNPGEIAGNGVDDDGNGYVDDIHGYDFYNNDGNPMDDNSHGTHCAGTIGGRGNNFVGVVGVSWYCRIVGAKFLGGNGSGSTADAISAVQYCAANSFPLSSNSWGGGGFTQGLYDAIQTAGDNHGHLFIAAAGNSGSNGASYPGGYDCSNIICVAATDSNENLAGFSQYHATEVDLGAPGVDIMSTTPNGGYSSFSGTSMATPHVAGGVALVYSVMGETATAAEVKALILDHVRPVSSLNGYVATGGILDVDASLENTYLGPKIELLTSVPESMDPGVSSELRISVDPREDVLVADSIVMQYRLGGGAFTSMSMTDEGNGEWSAVLPGADCDDTPEFFFQVEGETAGMVEHPSGGASSALNFVIGDLIVAFADNCDTDPGWTVTGDASDGLWERGIPAGGGNRPQSDCDSAASYCWLTENTPNGGGDVDDGETILVSPRIDATGVGSVSYCFWYRNIGGGQNVEDDVFQVDISDDDGTTWTNVLTVGPTGPGTTGNWSTEETFFADVPGFEVNDSFRIRFNASDLNQTSRVEAAVDNIMMVSLTCEPDTPDCTGDVNGDDVVDVNDILAMLNDWGDCGDCPSDTNDDGVVDVNDILALLANYGDC
ncbi:MAG: S8 family serine peptidase [Phycisphaerales bacterium]|nr:S8 family serine peptidase [Phycisphaerales bacterium]